MSWKSDSLSTSPRIFRLHIPVAIFCCVVFCCNVDHCQGQITGVNTVNNLDLASASQTDGPEETQAVRDRFIEFERQLNAMLKTRREEEKQFVGLVVNQIRLGLIPSKLVSTSFEWVRKQTTDDQVSVCLLRASPAFTSWPTWVGRSSSAV